MTHWIAIVIALPLAACHTPPAPSVIVVPPDSASDATTSLCGTACSALARAGCPEGTDPQCVRALDEIETSRLVRMSSGAPMTCAALAVVTNASGARMAGIECDGGLP